MWLILLSLTLLSALYIYFKNIYNYWEKRGVPTPKYKWLFGNLARVLFMRKSYGQVHTEFYAEFKGYNYVGFYKFMKPGIIIRNKELVKEVLKTKFWHFQDNDTDGDEKHDLFFAKNPFNLKGEKWKKARAQLAPVFSTSKVKSIMPLLLETMEKLEKYLDTEPNAYNGTGLEAKDIAFKYTCDNVASCAFGLNGRSFEDPKAEFMEAGKKLITPSFINGLKLLFVFILPSLSSILKIKYAPDDVVDFFRNIIKNTKKYRVENNIVRKDFLDMMFDLQTKINDENEFNFDDITAHSGSFFVDGAETSSIVISFAIYDLAARKEIQEKLRQEIDQMLQKYDNKITYDAVNEMTYLDCFLKESLRINVPFFAMSKRCTKPYKLPPLMEDGTGPTPTIEPGVTVIIPALGFHMDEKYYPNPKQFKPERFSEENKDDLVKFTWLPFGDGPRVCMGQIFGILQTKLALITIVSKYYISVNKKTQEPIQVNPQYFLLSPIGGLWLDFKKRNVCLNK